MPSSLVSEWSAAIGIQLRELETNAAGSPMQKMAEPPVFTEVELKLFLGSFGLGSLESTKETQMEL